MTTEKSPGIHTKSVTSTAEPVESTSHYKLMQTGESSEVRDQTSGRLGQITALSIDAFHSFLAAFSEKSLSTTAWLLNLLTEVSWDNF